MYPGDISQSLVGVLRDKKSMGQKTNLMLTPLKGKNPQWGKFKKKISQEQKEERISLSNRRRRDKGQSFLRKLQAHSCTAWDQNLRPILNRNI